MRELQSSESAAIVYLRSIAMISIVVGHLFQSLESSLIYVFNVGVQVFLIISGYLYGHRMIVEWRQWFTKRFLKIYLPYLLFILVVIPLLFVLTKEGGAKNFIVYLSCTQGLLGGYAIEGLGHLWFLTAIIICYFITPVLQFIREKGYSDLLIYVVILITLIDFTWQIIKPFQLSWIVLYAISYMYPTIKKRTKLILCVLCFLAVIFIIASSNSLPNPNSIEHLVAHMLGGILIVGALISVFDTFKIESYPLALKVTDRYSYYVYLTHYVFLFGPLALIALTNIILLNIMFVILAAVVSSVLLYRLHNLIIRAIDFI